MRKIEAIIRPAKLAEVQEGLTRCGVRGMTVSEVLGCGLQKGQVGVYRGKEYSINLLPKVRVEIVVPADSAAAVIAVILDKACSGEVGDGKIFVTPVEQAYRIRTGEKGRDAL